MILEFYCVLIFFSQYRKMIRICHQNDMKQIQKLKTANQTKQNFKKLQPI